MVVACCSEKLTFVEKCQSVAADSHFYAALAHLLLAFVQADLAYLQQTIQARGS